MKTLTQIKLVLLSTLLISLLSCSNEPTNQEDDLDHSRIYSDSTQREFEAIEKGASKTKKGKSNKSVATPLSPKAGLIADKSLKEIQANTTPDTPKVEKAELAITDEISAKNKERLIEINQTLAYYCMKHRKDPAYKSEENCLNFTKIVLNDCEKKHKIINTVMLNCIKDQLKKKRK